MVTLLAVKGLAHDRRRHSRPSNGSGIATFSTKHLSLRFVLRPVARDALGSRSLAVVGYPFGMTVDETMASTSEASCVRFGPRRHAITV